MQICICHNNIDINYAFLTQQNYHLVFKKRQKYTVLIALGLII